MDIGQWIDLPTVRALSQHASGTLAALFFFGIVRIAIEFVKLSAVTRIILEGLDEFVLVGLFVWLIYQMARLLWKGRIGNASTSFVMVA